MTAKVLLLVLLAVAGASLVGLVSRAPAELRALEPSASDFDPDLGARFTDDQVARGRAYRYPAYLGFAVSVVIEVVALLLLARGLAPPVVARVERLPGGTLVHAALLGIAVVAILTLVQLPLSFVRGYVIEHAWGLSTQDAAGWLADKGRGLLVGSITAAFAAVAFFAVVRWQPRTWWLWGWGAFTVLTAILVFLWPLVVAPLFNRFTPLTDDALTARIRATAATAGVDIDEVLVADASRRTTAENAYVAGLGSSKRVVVYDTLLAGGREDEVMFVVAHELGHERESHVLKNVVIASAGLFVSFLALAALAKVGRLWEWGGAQGISDLRALPLLMAFSVVAGLLVTPASAAISRAFERHADRIALELTDDPDAAVGMFRRLALVNISDLDPPRMVEWALFTHPPIAERISSAQAASTPDP